MNRTAFSMLVGIGLVILIIGCHESLVDRNADFSTAELSTLDQLSTNKKKDRCTICHFQEDQNTYKKLDIPCGNAFDAHVKHEDGAIGEPVPGQDGYVFGSECELVELEADCPCFTEEDLIAIFQGNIGYCNTSSMVGILPRGRLAYQNIIDNICKYVDFGNVRSESTTSAEQSACISLIEKVIADCEPTRIFEDQQVCAILNNQ